MRQSSMSVLFAAALVFHSYEPSGALPMSKGAVDDASLEQDVFASLLGDKAADNGLGDADLGAVEGRASAAQRVIVIATPSLWRDLRALGAGATLYKRRLDFGGQQGEHGDASQDLSVPVQRRDTRRCMVGRVYRPCWEV